MELLSITEVTGPVDSVRFANYFGGHWAKKTA